MAKQSKRERMMQAASFAHSGKNIDKVQDGMNQMLWVLAEGTRYQEDVEIALDILEQRRQLRDEGRYMS